jgi:hypothetical protein
MPTFRNTVCAIFIGGVSSKSNRDEIVAVILLAYTAYEDGTGRRFRNVGT